MLMINSIKGNTDKSGRQQSGTKSSSASSPTMKLRKEPGTYGSLDAEIVNEEKDCIFQAIENKPYATGKKLLLEVNP